jgi:RNA polymerase sigma-70 factor (ECF subfamily)
MPTHGAPLLAEAQSNDVAAIRAVIAELHESHYPAIARYCALRIGNLSEAEDIASEVFIRAIRNAGRLRNGKEALVPWLYRTAHHLSVDHLRRRSRRGIPDDLDAVGEQVSGENVEAAVERAIQFESLVAALQHLSEAERQVIALRFSDGLRSEEVAEILQKSPGAVRQMQHSALMKLRKILRWDWPDSGQAGG